ncbi:pheromone a factor receptor, partial [Tremellales sp. Uapishka_1]
MRHPEFPFWSFVSIVIVLIPAPWHYRARNVATMSIIFWLTLSNLVLFVNTLIWADNYKNTSPIWCDISARCIYAVSLAIPACSLAQMRRLESVAATRRSVISGKERTVRLWTEIAICIGFPLFMLAIHYTVQGHRYDLTENFGPTLPTFENWPAVTLVFIVPICMCIGSVVYASLAIRWFLVRRLQFRTILAASDSGLTTSRYLRLIALAVTDVSVVLFLALFELVQVVRTQSISTDLNWQYTHDDFGQISQWPEDLSNRDYNTNVVVPFYMGPVYSLLFFIFFGFGEEAVAEYVALGARLVKVLERVGLKRKQSDTSFELHPPTLGSKVEYASDTPWNATRNRSASESDNISEKIFESIECGSLTDFNRSNGIPVTVERSVV